MRLKVFLVVALLAFALPAHAATLSFTNPPGTVGQTLSVSVLVSAASGESLNGVSARVNFPTDKLTLLSVSKAGSIITFWAEEPSFSNSAGTASLEGIVPNPGYSGQGGRVLTFVFQVKAPGTATLSFGNASVLANDGRGTNILSSASPRTLTLSPFIQTTPPKKDVPAAAVKPKPLAEPEVGATTSAATSAEPAVAHAPGIFYDTPPPSVVQLGRLLVFLLAAIGLLALLLAGYLTLSRVLAKRRKALNTPDVVHRSFSILKNDIAEQVAQVKREPRTPLSEDEIGFLDQFERDLADVERIVETKLKKEGP